MSLWDELDYIPFGKIVVPVAIAIFLGLMYIGYHMLVKYW
jgi:hypothetical protein